MSATNERPLLVVSVDVEALPARASEDHVERLIWGEFPGEKRYGLREIMRAAEEVDAPLTCFLEYAAEELHGRSVSEVADEIAASGHDLQLHLHPEILPESYWDKRGMTKPAVAPNRWAPDVSKPVFREFAERLAERKGEMPEAFRAGSFRSNAGYIEAMGELGMPVSSNMAFSVYVGQERAPIGSPKDSFYVHSNGVMEVPLTQLPGRGGWVNLEFPWRQRARYDADEAFRRLAADGRRVAVMLLHSWVLLARPEGGQGHFGPGSEESVEALREVLRAASEHFEIVSMSQLGERASAWVAQAERLDPPQSSLIDPDGTISSDWELSEEEDEKPSSPPVGTRTAREKPRFGIVIGGMRCGSTAAYRTLVQHPKVCSATRKEVHFFSSEEHWAEGPEWYLAQWPDFDPELHEVRVEATTHYSKYPAHSEVPARMASMDADIRLIYSVRDPLDRIESHLAFQIGKGYLREDGREALLKGVATRYSSYNMQAQQYLEHFPKKRMLVVIQEQMKHEPEAVFPRLFEHIGVEEFTPEAALVNAREKYVKPSEPGEGAMSSKLTPSEERELAALLEDDVHIFCATFGLSAEHYWPRFFRATRG